ncbi:hypothetical protein D3C86_1776970 [compost metagenome]
MCQIVGVEHDNSIILARHSPQFLQHPFDGITLAPQIVVGAHTGVHPVLPYDLGRPVRAVVADDKYIVQILGIIKLFQIFHQCAHNLFLIVRCNQNCK